MNRKLLFRKTLFIMLLIATSNVKLFGGDLKFTLYGGLGNLEPSEKVNPVVFRTYKEWDNYIDHHFLADTRCLSGIPKITYKWKSDSAKFDRSVSVAFEGNRITRIVDVCDSVGKIIIKYKPDDEEYFIIDYQYDPAGLKTPSTAIVFYFISCEEKDISDKEFIFMKVTDN